MTTQRKYRLTLARILAAAQRDEHEGFCTACGADADGVEPDAQNYRCEECGAMQVFGAAELLMHGIA